jgi:hypothetical protein
MRGIFDTVSETVLVHLLEHLPQTAPHSAWMPGQLLDSTFLGKLESEAFTGYAAFAIQPDWLGGLLFYQGKPIESWRRALGGMENRAEAYRNLQSSLHFTAMRLYMLPAAVVPCVAALSVGASVESYHAAQVSPPEVQHKLEQGKFSGAVVFEDGTSAQAWYVQRGQSLLEPPFPGSFGVGRLHLVAVPPEVPTSVVQQAKREAQAAERAEVEHLRHRLFDLLRQQVGDNANELLETSQLQFESSPKELQEQIFIWLEDNFGEALRVRFQQEIRI